MFNSQGFRKQYNVPDSAGGETNGLYAAVTKNDVVPMDSAYFAANTPEPFDFWDWDDVHEFVDNVGGIYSEYQRRQIEAERLRREAERAARPTMGDQFAGLTFWEQAAFVFAVAGFAFVIFRGR